MLGKLKADFYSLVSRLGYNVSDTRNFEGTDTPWLLVRTGSYERLYSYNLEMIKITLIVDIFSSYDGEKEIIDIIDDIVSYLPDFVNARDEILYCHQKDLKILDDKSIGTLKKHGVLTLDFLMGSSTLDEEEEDNE